MSKYRIVKRTLWDAINKEYFSYYYIDKAFGPFWSLKRGGFDTLEEAEDFLTIAGGKDEFNETMKIVEV